MTINYLLPWIVAYWSICQPDIQFALLLGLVIYAVLRKEFPGKWANIGWGVVLIIVGNLLAAIFDYIVGWRLSFVYRFPALLLYYQALGLVIPMIVLGTGLLFFSKFFRFHLVRNEIDSPPPKLTTTFLLRFFSFVIALALIAFSVFVFDNLKLMVWKHEERLYQDFARFAVGVAYLSCVPFIVSVIFCPNFCPNCKRSRIVLLGLGVVVQLLLLSIYGFQILSEIYYGEVTWSQLIFLTLSDLASTILSLFVVLAIRHLLLKTGLSLVGVSGRIPAVATSSSLDEVGIFRVLES